jgi:excisionase family DNA binding protein
MPNPEAANDFLDVAQLAGWLNITQRHVRRLVAEKRVPVTRMGRLLRFERSRIQAWLDQHSEDPGDGNGRAA